MKKFLSRYIKNAVNEDLESRMVFVGGPRQVGKTTFSLQFLTEPETNHPAYLNWDNVLTRSSLMKGELPPNQNFIVLDEIHKYARWRNLVKGFYDTNKSKISFIITGSARLDYYRKGGDSLQGRYHYYRLHPFSLMELNSKATGNDFKDLLKFGGFPEPFLGGSEVEAKRWSREYRNRLINEEITNLENVSDLGNLELLSLRLPQLVGSPLSINSIREDLQVSHKRVSKWLNILERTYAIFRISPFGSSKLRAVKKEQKHYHYDWSLIPDLPLRFENMVAMHLLKWVHFEQDTKGRDLELKYFRDVDGREVDFVITENMNPIYLIEAKWKDAEIPKGLKYLKKRFPNVKAYQISATGKKDYITLDGIRVLPSLKFLSTLV